MITKVTLLQVFFGQSASRENAPDIEIWSIQSPNIFSFSSPIYSQKEYANVFQILFAQAAELIEM